MPAPIHVVTCLSNFGRFNSRYVLYERWLEEMLRSDFASITTVEVVFDQQVTFGDIAADRALEASIERRHPRLNHVVLRTRDVLWLKERALNLAVRNLPSDWQHVAWIDADTSFERPNIAAETVAELQTYDVVQMFEQAQDMDPEHRPLKGSLWRPSFMRVYLDEAQPDIADPQVYHPGYGATGLAWAWRRSAYEAVGGWLDFGVLGSGDWHMAFALVGNSAMSVPAVLRSGYRDAVDAWQERALAGIEKNVGVVKGSIRHWYHGPKERRLYGDRWKLLNQWGFDPNTDLRQDVNTGLWLWSHTASPRMQGLRDAVRWYHQQRNEDDIRID